MLLIAAQNTVHLAGLPTGSCNFYEEEPNTYIAACVCDSYRGQWCYAPRSHCGSR